ncbi:CAP domain-containing protein [Granulicella arctica]|uniref:CAP domain-containing protein n=1 Tax=Granulicella arctica TaxID=940613 RepID=UPI0021E03E97|nr:CAP domain-containing protein [Granulicella arctica]
MSNRSMGTLRYLRLLAGFALLTASFAPVYAQSSTVAEQYLLSAVNQERALRKLGPVRLDSALVQAAVTHARQMAAHGSISHRFSGEPELSTRGSQAGAHFDRITENVAEGPTAVILHDAWMHSPGHRANILDPDVDAIGIAVLVRNGQLYAVEDFQSTVQSLTLAEQEGAVGLLLDRAGLDLVPDANARKTCAMSAGYAGDQQPSFVVRYTTGDISTLPSKLKERLALAQDHQASVGACSSRGAGAFSTYSIAVVLYP